MFHLQEDQRHCYCNIPAMNLFDPDCKLCPRLARHLSQVKAEFPGYHARPVASFGVERPRLLIVGLAPGMHGANASGRPFTGDYAGILLYETLHKFGFSNKPESLSVGDGLLLKHCRITNAIKCLPPENKPLTSEINTCNRFLEAELRAIPHDGVILALGRIAHNAVLKAFKLRQTAYLFGHGNIHQLANRIRLIDSYHCSRYNTQTGRLTVEMFRDIFYKIHEILSISI